MTNPCRDENECKELLRAAAGGGETRWELARLARIVVQALAVRQIGIDPLRELARACRFTIGEEDLLVPWMLYHARVRGRTIAASVDLEAIPICRAVREWIEVEREARLGYWLVARARRKRATLVDLLWGEECEVTTLRSIAAIEGEAILGRVVRFAGVDSLACGLTSTLREEVARCAAFEARASSAGTAPEVLLRTWMGYSDRRWEAAIH